MSFTVRFIVKFAYTLHLHALHYSQFSTIFVQHAVKCCDSTVLSLYRPKTTISPVIQSYIWKVTESEWIYSVYTLYINKTGSFYTLYINKTGKTGSSQRGCRVPLQNICYVWVSFFNIIDRSQGFQFKFRVGCMSSLLMCVLVCRWVFKSLWGPIAPLLTGKCDTVGTSGWFP